MATAAAARGSFSQRVGTEHSMRISPGLSEISPHLAATLSQSQPDPGLLQLHAVPRSLLGKPARECLASPCRSFLREAPFRGLSRQRSQNGLLWIQGSGQEGRTLGSLELCITSRYFTGEEVQTWNAMELQWRATMKPKSTISGGGTSQQAGRGR